MRYLITLIHPALHENNQVPPRRRARGASHSQSVSQSARTHKTFDPTSESQRKEGGRRRHKKHVSATGAVRKFRSVLNEMR